MIVDIPDDWLPTAANINALPKPLFNHIHELVSAQSAADHIAEATILRDQVDHLSTALSRALQKRGKRNGVEHAWYLVGTGKYPGKESDCIQIVRALGTTDDGFVVVAWGKRKTRRMQRISGPYTRRALARASKKEYCQQYGLRSGYIDMLHDAANDAGAYP